MGEKRREEEEEEDSPRRARRCTKKGMKGMSEIVDAEFVRYPRALGGEPAPEPLDLGSAVNGKRARQVESMIRSALLNDCLQKEWVAFNLGNRK